jgi:preprotein translocase subunit YajC
MTSLPYSTLAILQAPGGQTLLAPLLMYGGIFAIFYFLLIRPQQQQRKKHELAVMEVKKGDRIVTAGGIIGEVQHVKVGEKVTVDDEITIKSGESRLIVERGRIAKIFSTSGASSSSDKVA